MALAEAPLDWQGKKPHHLIQVAQVKLLRLRPRFVAAVLGEIVNRPELLLLWYTLNDWDSPAVRCCVSPQTLSLEANSHRTLPAHRPRSSAPEAILAHPSFIVMARRSSICSGGSCGGKIHRSDISCSWRVFLRATDRCDRKIAWKGDEQGSLPAPEPQERQQELLPSRPETGGAEEAGGCRGTTTAEVHQGPLQCSISSRCPHRTTTCTLRCSRR